mgnify:FL=1
MMYNMSERYYRVTCTDMNGKFRQYKIKARSKQQASRKAYDIMQEQRLYNMIVIGIVPWSEMFNGVGVDVD